MEPRRIDPEDGQESVWDYPRPPRTEDFGGRIRVVFNCTVIADSHRAIRVLETSHPPVFYIPMQDIRMEMLTSCGGGSVCEWKGPAAYYSVTVGSKTADRSAWRYPDPTPEFIPIKDCIAFYPSLMAACYVDDEKATPQPGDFYGGWVTSRVVGPFKGEPGTMHW